MLTESFESALEKKSNRAPRTTKMTPFEKSTYQKLIPNLIFSSKKKKKLPKFQVEDFVRVPDERKLYSKCCKTNWNREFFKIHSINNTSPVTYILKDENKEILRGKYYEQEFLRPAFIFKSNSKTLESMNTFHKLE